MKNCRIEVDKNQIKIYLPDKEICDEFSDVIDGFEFLSIESFSQKLGGDDQGLVVLKASFPNFRK